MKLFFDFLPIIVFFVAYKLGNIYLATALAILAVFAQISINLLRGKRPDMMQLITLGMITLLGGATLLLKNELFIKWKPTVVYWILGVVFMVTPYFTRKTLVQKMLDNSLTLPQRAWQKLNCVWISFFAVMGLLNLYVVYTFTTDFWVNFKLFGTLGLTFVFVLLQGLLIYRLAPNDDCFKKN